jgi:hypothetical protein
MRDLSLAMGTERGREVVRSYLGEREGDAVVEFFFSGCGMGGGEMGFVE